MRSEDVSAHVARAAVAPAQAGAQSGSGEPVADRHVFADEWVVVLKIID